MRPGSNSHDSAHRSPGAQPSILVIDEDRSIQRLLHRELTKAGYQVHHVEPDGRTLGDFGEEQFDLVVLDIDSRLFDGQEAIRTLRAASQTPLLVVSASITEDAVARALENGADEFVRMPFGLKELLARVKNVLRRRAREQGKQAQVVSGDLEIDLLQRRIRCRGLEVHLSRRCFEVLRMLAERPGRVLSHAEILSAVWGPKRAGRIEYLRFAIRELRHKLEQDPAHPRYILTETRVGYRFELLRD